MVERSIDLEKKIKFLVVALSISCAFNIALLVNFSFLAFGQKAIPQPELLSQPAIIQVREITSTLKDLLGLPMDQLVKLLKDDTLLEEGYKMRDLSLAILVNYHYLNMDKALPGQEISKRVALFEKKDTGEQFEIILFPGLRSEHFSAISKFIESEKWPYTAEGLFFELKKNGLGCDSSLKDAFYKTGQFEWIELLFKRNEFNISSDIILKVLLDADFSILEQQLIKLKHQGEFSKEFLVSFLKEYIRFHSATAAGLCIEFDSQYIAKNLEDAELKKLIKLIKNRNSTTFRFLQSIMSSLRSDIVRKEAAIKFYSLFKEDFSKEINPVALLKKLTAKEVQKTTSFEPKKNEQEKYKIKEGDTLWGIAKAYKVSVQKLIEENQIDKNKPLQIGKSLLIPKPMAN